MPGITLPSSGASTGIGITQLGQFFGGVLAKLGIKATTANITWLASWAHQEGTAADNNPLATTYTAPDISSTPLAGNPDNVQNYATEAGGELATAATLSGYPAIISALQTGDIISVANNPNTNPALIQEFTVWSGNTKTPSAGLAYFESILKNALGGGPGSSITGSIGNAVGDVTSALNPDTYINDATSWLSSTVPYAALYALLVLFSAVLLIIGLLRMAGVRAGSVAEMATAGAAAA